MNSNEIHFFIGSLSRGGTQRVCTVICNWFVEQKYEINLVVVDDSNPEFLDDLDERIDVKFLNVSSTKRSFIEVNRYLGTVDPNIVFSFNRYISLVLIFLRETLGHNFWLISRTRNTLSMVKKHSRSIWHSIFVDNLVKLLYHRADCIIAQSNGMATDLIENYRVDPENITVINNPVSHSILNWQGETFKTKNQILYVGSLTFRKGVDRLIHAFEQCLEVNPDLKLCVVGDGPKKEFLIELCKTKDIYESVSFEGTVSDVGPYYKSSKVTALSSRYEGFPNVLIESIVLGTPVVAFDCPSGPKSIINDGINGFLVDEDDINGLAEKIIHLIQNPIESNRIRNTGKNYYPENILPQYQSLIDHSHTSYYS